MPIQNIELIYNGVTDFPDVVIDGTFDYTPVNNSDGTDDFYIRNLFLTGSDTFLTNNGIISESVTLVGDHNVLLVNSSTGLIGGGPLETDVSEQGDIKFTGANTHLIANFGTIIADIQMGHGQDGLYNTGLIEGDLRMGAGNDYLVNDSATADFTDQTGVMMGRLNMGSGNDVVLNAGQMGRVNLGSGNDSYSVINPGDVGSNYNNPLATAARVVGGTGNDTMYGGHGDDQFFGGDDSDVLNGHNGDDKLYGGKGKDTLRGGNGDDRLFGGDSKDRLVGGNGDDTLSGGTGRDILIGGRGDDRMTGGSGADTFVLRSNTFNQQIGNDTITDFSSDDRIILYPNFAHSVDDELQPIVTDELVLSFIEYFGNYAVLDLNALGHATGLQELINGDNSVTFLGVSEGDLTGDNFYTGTDYFGS